MVGDYDPGIVNLQMHWEGLGYVEVFDPAIHSKADYPLVKDSNSVAGSSPEYTGLYHARVLSDGSDDPLVIVTFKGVVIPQQQYDAAVIESLITHDVMFLPVGPLKGNPQAKKKQRIFVCSVIENTEINPILSESSTNYPNSGCIISSIMEIYDIK
ncbi:hypothetical protein N5923_09770 [Erwiniaceae bacterium BAC15a-03b]|uniref:Uncharacterized protein n=1 Tax=Winslowiella arboricola TaxID=2978220 RepID=A0A9J6PMY5_9GAMM|nr:hypothetical protein [Winslowiella arboricola]MCU5773869.1 hypothetical protein [Winslowiella arboricola]MCU5777779.1 hypothetical protein [Winslowiella arboricola]